MPSPVSMEYKKGDIAVRSPKTGVTKCGSECTDKHHRDSKERQGLLAGDSRSSGGGG